MPPTPTPPIRTPRPTPPNDPKSQKKKWLALTALLTSTPFLIAIAVHLLALLGLGSIVIFKGGNPLAMFKSENVDSADSAPESSAPPSTEDSPPEDSAPAMAETTPTETDTSTEILALSTPTTVPTFAPTAPAKLTAPTTTPGQGSSGLGTKSGGGSGGGKGRRTSKSTLFGFSETTEDDLVGTMYDLKLDASGRKPTDLSTKDTDFYGAVRGILSGNRVNPAALRKYFAVPKKLGATQIFMPMGQASEAPKIFGVADKVKPNYWLIHYRGRCAAPTSGQFRFVGKADDLLWVAVDGRTVLEAHWDTSQSLSGWKPKDHIDEYSIVDFMEGNTDEDRAKAHLVFGDWMNWDAGKPHEIELLLGEYGGGRFFGLLLIEQKEKETKLGKNKERPVLPLFVTAEPDAEQKNTARRSKLEFPKETPVFAVSGSAGAGPSSSSSPSATKTPQPTAETKPPASSANSDSAADPAYGTDWKNESTAGSGFGPWQLLTNADPNQKTFAGFYLAEEKDKPNITPVASNGRAWGLFANGDNFPKACAFRPLSQPLAPGQSLSLDLLRSPFPESSAKGGSVGLSLRQGTTAASPDDYNANSRFELCALQDKPTLQLFDGEKESSTTFPSSTLAFRLTFLLKTSDTYDLKLEPLPLGQGSPVELKNRRLGGNANSPIESLVLFNRNGQTDSWCNYLQISTP
jgi:hypothetical protein